MIKYKSILTLKKSKNLICEGGKRTLKKNINLKIIIKQNQKLKILHFHWKMQGTQNKWRKRGRAERTGDITQDAGFSTSLFSPETQRQRKKTNAF